MADMSPITIARFWSKVDVRPSNQDCWEWQGSRNPDGYGNFRVPEYGHRVNAGAHRVAYHLANGAAPSSDEIIRHKCDNPSCCNPEHLEAGSVSDNMRDCVERGRHPFTGQDQSGVANNASKLTAKQVSEIRALIDAGLKNTIIAARFGVHHATISAIRTGKTWKREAS